MAPPSAVLTPGPQPPWLPQHNWQRHYEHPYSDSHVPHPYFPPDAAASAAGSGAGPDGFAAAAQSPAVFYTAASLCLDSSPSKSGGTYSPRGASEYGAALRQAPPDTHQLAAGTPRSSHWQEPVLPPQDFRLQQMEQMNADLMRQCQELQERLAAAEAQQQQPPSTPSTQHPGVGGDSEMEHLLQRRLAAKQREAEAAARAAEAKQQQLQQREAELEAERARSATLSDDVARWKDEFTRMEREAKALQQRLEAATSHSGLLDDSVTALKKKNAELNTALAQKGVAVRQLEDRLRALQGSEGNKEKQLDALHTDKEALRSANATLQQQNQQLTAEVERLGAALLEAREEAAALRSRTHELEQQVASSASQRSQRAQPPAGTSTPVMPAGRQEQLPPSSMRATSFQGGQQPVLQYRLQPQQPPMAAGIGAHEAAGRSMSISSRSGRDAAAGNSQLRTPPTWAASASRGAASSRYQQAPEAEYALPPTGFGSEHGPEADGSSEPTYQEAFSWPDSGTPSMYQQQQVEDLRTSQAYPYSTPPPQSQLQQWQQQSLPSMPAESASAAKGGYPGSGPVQQAGQPARGAFHLHNQPAFAAPQNPMCGGNSPYSKVSADSGPGSDMSSLRSFSMRPPGSAAPPHLQLQQWQMEQGPARSIPGSLPFQHHYQGPPSSRGDLPDSSSMQQQEVGGLAGQLSSMDLGAPTSARSPFGTEDTLQDMLARTQALEDRLLVLNAEKNELEAESARMPTHTTGRTLQERKRRAEVERRLDALNRECSSVRLQLRRLGVK